METLQLFRGDTIIVRYCIFSECMLLSVTLIYFNSSGKKRRDTVLICLSSDDVEEGRIQVNKVARNNLRVKLGDIVGVHQCLDIKYGKRVHILPFDDSIEGLSGNIFDVYLKPYFLEGANIFSWFKISLFTLLCYLSISTRSQRWHIFGSWRHANSRVQGYWDRPIWVLYSCTRYSHPHR